MNVSHMIYFIVCRLMHKINDKLRRFPMATNLCETKRDKKNNAELSEVNNLFQCKSFR